jgi:hypothetical protein
MEAEPDTLVFGEDVFQEPHPLAEDTPTPSNEVTEFSVNETTTSVNPEDLTLSLTVNQGCNVMGSIISVCKLPAAAMWAVLYSLAWVLKCVAGVVMVLMRAVGWAVASIVQLAVGLVCGVACAALALLKGVFSAVGWVVVAVCKLAACVACAAWATLKGVVFLVTWPVVQVVKLAAFVVRSVFRVLVWVLCTTVKAPVFLVLGVYCVIACVLRCLVRAPAALKWAVVDPYCSQCEGPCDWDPDLAKLGVAVPCAHRFPRKKVC